MGKKYVAYVGTYTHGTSKGIQVYDVNLEEGTLTERSEVEVSNASYAAARMKLIKMGNMAVMHILLRKFLVPLQNMPIASHRSM